MQNDINAKWHQRKMTSTQNVNLNWQLWKRGERATCWKRSVWRESQKIQASAALSVCLRSYCPPALTRHFATDSLNKTVYGRGVRKTGAPLVTITWTTTHVPKSSQDFTPNHFVVLQRKQQHVVVDLTLAAQTPQKTSTDSPQKTSTDSQQTTSTDSQQTTSTDSQQTTSTDSQQTTSTDSQQTTSTDSQQTTSTDSQQTTSTDSSQQ